jgi:hypothetical protein
VTGCAHYGPGIDLYVDAVRELLDGEKGYY